MAAEDQRVREDLARDGSLFAGYHPRMQAVHDHNAARLDDPESVDQRRAEVGLGPLAEDLERRRASIAATGERPPIDRAGRDQEKEAWLRRVGWRE